MKHEAESRMEHLNQVYRTTERGRSRRRTWFWLIVATASVTAMVYWEFTALLYVLSTLAMCTLLLIVAFSKLVERDAPSASPEEESDSRSDVPAPETLSVQGGNRRRVKSQRRLKIGGATNE